MKFKVIIPARFLSTRLPGKMLLDIAGKPMIQHTWERAIQSGADSVVIATDSQEILAVAEKFGAKACMTDVSHQSGTDRIAEVINVLGYSDSDIIVNVQGDEPLIPPELIKQVAENLSLNKVASIATLCEPITTAADLFDPNIVKVVSDQNGFALYFSRAPIAWDRKQFGDYLKAKGEDQYALKLNHFRHIGIYAYRALFNKKYSAWPSCTIEQMESLEQLRALWHGEKIHVAVAIKPSAIGVDTEEDLQKVRKLVVS